MLAFVDFFPGMNSQVSKININNNVSSKNELNKPYIVSFPGVLNFLEQSG